MIKQSEHTIQHTRAQLNHLEMLTDATLTAAHTQAVHKLAPMLTTLYKQIATMQQSGQQSGVAWLYSIGQLHNIQNAVHFYITHFAQRTRDAVAKLQQQAAAIASASVAHLPASAHFDHVAAHMTNTSTRTLHLYASFGPQASTGVTLALVRGVSLQTPVKQIASDVAKALDNVLQRALVIAGEAMMAVYRGVTHATMQANADVALGWYWISDLDGTPSPCIACILMHGTKHPLSATLQSHVRCRCVQITYFADSGNIVGQSGTDWFLAQDSETQQDIMGLKKWQAWKSGAFTLQDILGTEPDGTVYVKSLKELGVKS